MDRNELAVTVMREINRRLSEALARPRPPAWRKWDVVADHGDREFGPLYSPQWFGDLTAAVAVRQRVLRSVRRLADAGLVNVFRSHGGRLERVRLTDAGLEVFATAKKSADTAMFGNAETLATFATHMDSRTI